jgi:hypothetical protein
VITVVTDYGYLHGGQHLEGQWDNIGVSALQVQRCTVVDPERKHNTGGDEKLVQTGQTTTDGSGCLLGNVEWHQHGSSLDVHVRIQYLYALLCEITRQWGLHTPTPIPLTKRPTYITAIFPEPADLLSLVSSGQ